MELPLTCHHSNTNNHKDLEEVCHGWCVIGVCGDFEGGAACFLSLESILIVPLVC